MMLPARRTDAPHRIPDIIRNQQRACAVDSNTDGTT
jgi:hypothetical protein